MNDTRAKLDNTPQTIDARIWAVDWLQTIKEHPSIPTDEGTMITWFANAIMAGYDEAQRRQKPERRFFVEVDSVLSLIVHRFGSALPENLKQEATKLYQEARGIYEHKS